MDTIYFLFSIWHESYIYLELHVTLKLLEQFRTLQIRTACVVKKTPYSFMKPAFLDTTEKN